MRANHQLTAVRAEDLEQGRLQTPMVATTRGLALSTSEWADPELGIQDPSWGEATSADGRSKSTDFPDRKLVQGHQHPHYSLQWGR